jgi:hypothetical protein
MAKKPLIKNHKIGGPFCFVLFCFVFPPFFIFLFWALLVRRASTQAPENRMRQSPQQR